MLATERIAFNPAEVVDPARVVDPAFILDPAAHMGDLFVYLFNLVPWITVGLWWRPSTRDTLPWTSDVVPATTWLRG